LAVGAAVTVTVVGTVVATVVGTADVRVIVAVTGTVFGTVVGTVTVIGAAASCEPQPASSSSTEPHSALAIPRNLIVPPQIGPYRDDNLRVRQPPAG
jgi:hypothetical protein